MNEVIYLVGAPGSGKWDAAELVEELAESPETRRVVIVAEDASGTRLLRGEEEDVLAEGAVTIVLTESEPEMVEEEAAVLHLEVGP